MARKNQMAVKSTRPLPKKQVQLRREQETGRPSTSATPMRGGQRRAAATPQGASAQLRARKPHRFKPGTVALRQIRKYQKTTKLVIRFAPFVRLVKRFTVFYMHGVSEDTKVKCWTPPALVSLQEAAEYHVVKIFERANYCAIHAKRVTIRKDDIQLARRIGQMLW